MKPYAVRVMRTVIVVAEDEDRAKVEAIRLTMPALDQQPALEVAATPYELTTAEPYLRQLVAWPNQANAA